MTDADTPVETSARHVIQHGDTVRGIDRMVQRQHRDARRKDDALGQGQGFGDEQFGHRSVFPHLGDVLADPGLVITEPVRLHDEINIPVVPQRRLGVKGIMKNQSPSLFLLPGEDTDDL